MAILWIYLAEKSQISLKYQILDRTGQENFDVLLAVEVCEFELFLVETQREWKHIFRHHIHTNLQA